MEALKRRSCLSSYKADLFPTHTILAGKTFSVLSLSPLNSFYRLFPHPKHLLLSVYGIFFQVPKQMSER